MAAYSSSARSSSIRVIDPFTRSIRLTKSSPSWLSTSTSALPMPTTSNLESLMRGSTVFEGGVGSPTGASPGWGSAMRRSVVVVLAWGILMAPSVWVATAPAEAAPGDHRLDCERLAVRARRRARVAAGRVRPRRLQAHIAARPPDCRLTPEPMRPEGRGGRPGVGPVARHRTTSHRCSRLGHPMARRGTHGRPGRQSHVNLGEAPPPCSPGVADWRLQQRWRLRHRRLRGAHRPQRQRRWPTPRT